MARNGSWSGFSDEDLRKLKEDHNNGSTHESINTVPQVLKSASLMNKKHQAKMKHNHKTSTTQHQHPHPNPPPEQRLSTEPQELDEISLSTHSSDDVNSITSTQDNEQQHDIKDVKDSNALGVNGCCMDEVKQIRATDASKLEQFQQRQKMIEEQNKQRRTLLIKAIQDRKKKTQEETQRLVYIQQELQKLDSLVSNDVAILRNQIELASLDFTESQKRYEKAEREFVQAKLELFRRLERKEQLTEHLCAIIEDNEGRKAKKLGELMHQLELEELLQEYQENGGELVLPELCAMSEISHAYRNSLKLQSESKNGEEKSSESSDPQNPGASGNDQASASEQIC